MPQKTCEKFFLHGQSLLCMDIYQNVYLLEGIFRIFVKKMIFSLHLLTRATIMVKNLTNLSV